MLQSIVTWIWIASGVLLVISVLLHSPKGDGMGGLAASGGSMFSSARSAEATPEPNHLDPAGHLPGPGRRPERGLAEGHLTG